MVFVRELDEYVPEDEVGPAHHCLRISGTEQRGRLARGEELPPWFTPPEVAAELRRAFPPRARRGLCVLVRAGLPHADRAAAAVSAQLRELGRTVTVLDGFVWTGGGAAFRLVSRLLGDVMRNGGAVVCSGEVAQRLAVESDESALPVPGLVLDVREESLGAGRTESVTPADHGRAGLLVPRGTAPELVSDLVLRHLRTLGYVAGRPLPPLPVPRQREQVRALSGS
jgi:hypothetical protein